MESLRNDVENVTRAVGALAASVDDEEGEWRGFVEEAQLAFLVSLLHGVHVNTSIQQVAMEVGDQRADIATGVRAMRRLVLDFHPVRELLDGLVPLVVVRLVDGEALGVRGQLHVLVGQDELTDGGVEREAVNAVASRVDQHAGRAIQHVASGHLFASLEQLQSLSFLGSGLRAAPDAKDGSDGNVASNVGAAVQGIHCQGILAAQLGRLVGCDHPSKLRQDDTQEDRFRRSQRQAMKIVSSGLFVTFL